MKIVFIFFVICLYGTAQFSGTNLLEYQYGKLPDNNENMFHGVYSKPIINYKWGKFKTSVGLQIYQSPYADRNYTDVSWLSTNYKNKHWDVSLGNFNSTLARGILLRSFEIPGALLEDLSFRGKHYFYKDILGASVGFRKKKFSLRAMWGYTLNYVFPPSVPLKNRRQDEIAAFSGNFKLNKQTIGLSTIRVANDTSEMYYGAGELSGDITSNLNYYVSYAQKLSDVDKNNKVHAIYGSLNFTFDTFGISAEWKDYNNFLLGTGLNEPPALVKEHTYKVLNRSTHVLNPSNETGVQFEAYYSPNLNTSININYTKATNQFGKTFDYEEWFLELSSVFSDKTDFRVFIDYAQDQVKNESNRFSSGFFVNHSLPYHVKNLIFEFNTQTFKRDEITTINHVGDLTLRYKSKLFLTILAEWSNDRFLTNNSRVWFGSTVNYKWNNKNTFTLFAGERRGGPACNAGICYEILDFKGLEFRWVSRL